MNEMDLDEEVMDKARRISALSDKVIAALRTDDEATFEMVLTAMAYVVATVAEMMAEKGVPRQEFLSEFVQHTVGLQKMIADVAARTSVN